MEQCWIVTKGIPTKDGGYRIPKKQGEKVTSFMLPDSVVQKIIGGLPEDVTYAGHLLRQAMWVLSMTPEEQEAHNSKAEQLRAENIKLLPIKK